MTPYFLVGIYCLHLQVTYILKMEALCSSETSVAKYQPPQCHDPEDHSVNRYLCENHEPH
jgi:hypothetical protein